MAEPLPSSPRRLSARHVMEPLVALAGGRPAVQIR